MKATRWLFIALCGLLLGSTTALAQFDTPNRSFHNATGFPLDGRHLTVECEACHLNGQYQATPTTCFACHWQRRRDDPYQTRLGTQCEQCHRPTSWTAVQWDHAGQAGVPLNLDHRLLACESCHSSRVFAPGSTTCVSCHQRDFAATTAPNHAAAGFPLTCASCHRPGDSTWQNGGGGGFDHNAVFPLVGVHAAQACQACHVNNLYLGTSRDCVGCHRNDYNRTSAPNHAAAGFPTTCETCHRPTDPSWRNGGGGQFDHNAIFPLQGAHAMQACTTCHVNNVYRGTPRECVGCHQADYNRTASPNHAAAGFPTTCETCHRPTDPSWQSGSGFDHQAVFALVGNHARVDCAVCHVNNVFRGTPRDCVGCHQNEYNRTTSPNHAAANFPTTCDTCHRPTDPSWGSGSGFNHQAVFPLVGTHARVDCAVCHVNNVFRGTPRDCVGCHQNEYNRTTSPNHAAANFPTTCDTCHRATDAQWQGATFNHTAYFALVGRHAAASCASCHLNNVYRGTPRDCVGCHLSDYNGTRDPNHASAGFPTTCDSCHRNTDSSWDQGTFVHSWFPLTGPHNRPCAECHTTPSNYTQFSCTVCHSRSETDGHHREVGGYRYDSAACYACHPNGRH
jgi:hypothetical protein